MTHAVFNERVKLLAGTLKTIGIATIITGASVPTVGALHGTLATMPRWWLLLVASGCFAAGAGHTLRRSMRLGGCAMADFMLMALGGPVAPLGLGVLSLWAIRWM